MKVNKSQLLFLGAIIVLFTVFFLLRFANLEADAPLNLSFSAAPFSDEGNKADPARNFFLFGKSRLDDNTIYCENCAFQRNAAVDNIFVNIPFLLGVSLFGLHYFSIRLVSVVFGMLSILLVFFIVFLCSGKRAAIFAFLLTGFSFMFIMYNRLALLEIGMVFFELLSLFFAVLWFKRNRVVFFPLSFLFFGIAFLYKPIALFFFPALLASWFFGFKQSKKSFLKNIVPLAVCIIAVALMILFFALPTLIEFAFPYSEQISAKGISDIARFFTILAINRFFLKEFFLSALAVFALLFLGYKFFNSKKVSMLEAGVFAWLVFGIIFFSLIFYKPPRYLLYLIPGMAIASSLLLNSFFENRKFVLPKFSFSFKIFFIAWVLFFSFIVSANFNKFVVAQDDLGQMAIGILIGFVLLAVVLFAVFFAFQRLFSNCFPACFRLLKFFCFLLFFLFFVLAFYQYFSWLSYPQYSLVNSSRDFGGRFGNVVALGPWSEALCFETEFRCFGGTGEGANSEQSFFDSNINYLVYSTSSDPTGIALSRYLSFEKLAFEKVYSYKIGKFDLWIFRVEKTEQK